MDKIQENIIEIVWEYDTLDGKGVLKNWDEISKEFSDSTVAASDLLKEDFCQWAEEFEKEFDPKSNNPYLLAIQEFAEEKILKKYGKAKFI